MDLLLGSPGPRREEEGEDPRPLQVPVRVPAPRSQQRSGDAGGCAGGTAAARAFSRGGGGDAESQICHCFSPLPSPPGAKAKAKANATRGAAGPGSCAQHHLRDGRASARAAGGASGPLLAQGPARAMAGRRRSGCRVSALPALLSLLQLLLTLGPATPGRERRAPLARQGGVGARRGGGARSGGRRPGRPRRVAASAPPTAAATRSPGTGAARVGKKGLGAAPARGDTWRQRWGEQRREPTHRSLRGHPGKGDVWPGFEFHVFPMSEAKGRRGVCSGGSGWEFPSN